MPADVMNCEYWNDLKRRWHEGDLDKRVVTASLSALPMGAKILIWLDRPINQINNIHTLAKFDE